MRLDDHFGSSSTVQRNERVKLAASFWNNVGASMVLAGWQGRSSWRSPLAPGPKSASPSQDLSLVGFVIRSPVTF